MSGPDLRIRLFGRVLRQLPGTSITKMTVEDIARAQTRTVKRNRLVDAICGPIAAGVHLEDRSLAGPGGDLPVRVYRPTREASGPRPLIVNFHGGGWTLGNLEMADWICSHVADGVDAIVVSVAYRMAPTHRFPAAVDDSFAAVQWCARSADALAADGGRIGVMGDSAGGNLAAVVCLMARDSGGPSIFHQALIYPAMDLAEEWPSHQRQSKTPFATLDDYHALVAHYLGPDGDPHDWRASPLYAKDHSGLPPALVQVAEYDAVHDHGVAYAERLRAAGVPVQLSEYGGMPHGYLSFPGVCRDAETALKEIIAAQQRALRRHNSSLN
ncbi:MAG: alpha/beta hydrolase [Nocardioidaceae bacterium]